MCHFCFKGSLMNTIHNASTSFANLNISKQNSRNVFLHCNANNVIPPSAPILPISAWANALRGTDIVSLSTSVTIHFLLRHVTGATMRSVCRESKRCMTPCECLRSTTDTKRRATSGCRNSSALTHKTSLTRSSWTLPIKSTRGINERGRGLPTSGASTCFRCYFCDDLPRSKAAETMQAGNGSFVNVLDSCR